MEILEVGDEVDSLVRDKATERDIEKLATEKQEMVLMQQDGILKALDGITTLDEVERATGPLEW
jgi:type II secretory ATPase GspE/PulE/Tfp pilus assembly ATPase PilB-like protein